MKKKIFIDLEICRKCPECKAECGYFYHKAGKGFKSLYEYATYSAICRQCEQGLCVASCPKDALEKQKDGMLKRYNARCVSCKSCVLACPFGTIVPELVPYIDVKCDFCIGQSDKQPQCVKSCPEHAVKFIEIEADETKDLYAAGEHLIVHARAWNKEPVKK